MEIFADEKVDFYNFKVNKIAATSKEHVFYQNREKEKLLTYYAVDQDTLRLDFELKKGESLDLKIYEASNDLLSNPVFDIAPRTKGMMPKPFVLNDAIITKQSVPLNSN